MSLGGLTPPKPQHECVGTAQVAALQAEVAELAAFKAGVVELYTTDFMGKVTPPDPTSLLPRIAMDRMIARTARTAMHHDGKAPDKGVPLNLRSHLSVEWLKGLRQRLAFRYAAERARADRVRDLEWALASVQDKCCHAHPPAMPQTAPGPDVQLDRIESLVKQAASAGGAGPVSYGFLIGAVLVGLTHLVW